MWCWVAQRWLCMLVMSSNTNEHVPACVAHVARTLMHVASQRLMVDADNCTPLAWGCTVHPGNHAPCCMLARSVAHEHTDHPAPGRAGGHSACTLCNPFCGIARAALMLHMLVCTVLTIFQGRGRAFACMQHALQGGQLCTLSCSRVNGYMPPTGDCSASNSNMA